MNIFWLDFFGQFRYLSFNILGKEQKYLTRIKRLHQLTGVVASILFVIYLFTIRDLA